VEMLLACLALGIIYSAPPTIPYPRMICELIDIKSFVYVSTTVFNFLYTLGDTLRVVAGNFKQR
jgi:hypothetical protein